MPTASPPTPLWRSPTAIIIAGCLIALVNFGIRSSFGLYLSPLTQDHNWTRQEYGLALAIQNLMWGLGSPFAGMLAERFGTARVLAVGAVIYALGVLGMTYSTSILMFDLMAGLVTGLGIAFTSFGLALAAMAKVVSPAQRSLALGLGTAAGSLGQVLFPPLAQSLIGSNGPYASLLVLAACSLLILLLSNLMPNDAAGPAVKGVDQTLTQALTEAFAHPGYLLLTAGFFVCGFQLAFITVHFPVYVKDLGLDVRVGAYALMLIGLFNIAGCFISGMVGQRWSKPYSLSLIYLARSLAVLGLLYAPKTQTNILLFAAVFGILWLSTVPLTSGLIAQIFGTRFMATLYGIVFLSHQVGSFLGVWLGGLIYDRTGSYDGLWWLSIAMGVFAAVVHLPINEAPLARLAAKAA
jgi:predicted MFS family arabinose efflux permease